MRVILDGVFNHCGAFHKWLDREGLYKGKLRGAYRHADSPYHDYFYWNADGTYEVVSLHNKFYFCLISLLL